ncbi:hypothetical protein ACLB2K_004008 [Fragaria x ananassa]
MESSSPANIPRWAPSPSPSRSLLSPVEDPRIEASPDHNDYESAKDGISSSSSSMDRIFPFSNGFNGTITSTSTVSVVEKSVELAKGAYVRSRSGTMRVSLTWEDLWVGVSDRKGGHKMILQGLTGFAQPARKIYVLIDSSNNNKLKKLETNAGRLSSSTQQRGKILINGRKVKPAFGTSAYVTQDDTLMTTLTVREVVYYSAQLQLPNSMSKAEKKERAETTIREMGLQACMDTRIGGWSRKGLSGGQKRRVSICIEILTRPRLLFLDEPTSGLDSAASYHVMNRIVKLAHRDGRTIIASIHQPSSEVFELFQNLCLLSSGRTVYFGPASQAKQFFASNGFPCPTLRNPSDHCLITINKDFDIDIEQGHDVIPSTEEVINTLIRSYESSNTSKQVHHSVAEICQQKGGALEKGSQANFITQCLVLTRRSFVNMYRDLGYYWLRLAIYIALCLCVGTIFHDIGSTFGSIQARGSMLMFVASFLTFMAIGGFPSFVEDMKIFGRERLNGHYGVAAYVVGNTFSSIPYLLIISLIPGAIAYYLVASIVPDFLMGIITGAGIQGVMMLTGGFFRLPDDLPKPFWRYPMLMFMGIIKFSEKVVPMIKAVLVGVPKHSPTVHG